MKGYSNINGCIEDYKLLVVAKHIDPGRGNGESVTKYLIRKMNNKLKHSSHKFKSQMKRDKYNIYDLNLIAVNSLFKKTRSIDDFCCMMVDTYTPEERIRRILKSNAFKKGKLTSLSTLLPERITTKEELTDFIRSNNRVSHYILKIVCDHFVKNKWRDWLEEAQQERKVERIHGEWW